MKKITTIKDMLILNTYWIGLSFKWNALHPIILPVLILNYVTSDQKNSYLGLITFVGLIIAAVVQPLAGAISDGWVSRWGRRRPLIVLGSVFDVIFLLILGWMSGLAWIFFGYVGLQISSNLGQGPAQGLLPDRVTVEKLGIASGMKTFMDMTALIIASLAAGRLLGPQGRDAQTVILILIGVMLVSTAVTVLGTPEQSTEREKSWKRPSKAAWLNELKDQFKIDFRSNASYWWLIFQRGVFLLGIFGLQAFAQYYLQDVLKVSNPAQTTGDLLASLTVSLVILALAGGWLTDKFGPKKILLVACLLSSLGFVLIWMATSPQVLVVNGLILGAGIGLFLTASWASANQLAPAEEAGKYLGLTNLATAGSGALARLEGPLIDMLNARYPGQWLGYTGMFALGVLLTLLSAILINRVTINSIKKESGTTALA